MANKEKVSISMMVQPELDPKATKDLYRDIASLHKKLANVKVDFKDIAKQSSSNIKQINDMATAADIFAKRLSKGAQDSYKNLKKLGDELEQAVAEAESLSKAQKTAKSSSAKSSIAKLQGIQAQKIISLNKQLDMTKSSMAKYRDEMKKVQTSQKKYHKNLEDMGKFKGADMRAGLLKGFVQMTKKGGGSDGAAQMLKSLGKGAGGKVARNATARAASGGAEGGAGMMSMRGIAMAAGGVAMMAASMGVLVKLLMMASDHQTKLNKTLLDGTGFANDFTTSTQTYKAAIDDVRNAAIDSAGSLLEFGLRSEDALKVINKFAKESTGSIIQTRNELIKMGDGDIQAGVTKFTRNALAYGKALGMETDQVGSMMGSFVGDIGYSAQNVQGIMGEIVSAASTSSMPVHKFMDIFRQTIPHLELFTNRIEELAGTIKLLSKNMSPEQVKQFMQAWGGGLSGDDFKSRLKKTLVAGVGTTNKLLGEGFSKKADVMAAQLGGNLGSEFQAAFKSGDQGAMNSVITKAKAKGSADPALIGQMQRLMQAEGARRKGGALNTATAMKGASMSDQLEIFKAQRAVITGGGGQVSGIDEHVMEKLGYSQDQINSMNDLVSTTTQMRSALQEYGATTSKSMNDSLAAIIASRKYEGDLSKVTRKDMAEASERDIMAAAEHSVKSRKVELTAQDLAAQQVQQTTSISEKIDNVIAFWLEKVFQVLSPILDVLNNVFSWMTGDEDKRKSAKSAQSWQAGIEGSTYSKGFKKQMSMVTQGISNDLLSGGSGAAGAASSMGYLSDKAMNDKDFRVKMGNYAQKRAEASGMGAAETGSFESAITKALSQGDLKTAFDKIAELKGDDAYDMQEFAKAMASVGGISESANSLGPSRRPGSKELDIKRHADEYAAEQEVTDRVDVTKLGRLKGASAASAGMSAASITSESSLVEDQVKKTDEQIKAVEDGNKIQEKQKLTQEKQTRMMATGVAMNATQQTEKTINKATLEAFRVALTEFAIHNARMGDEGYASEFTTGAWNLNAGGSTIGDLAKVGYGDALTGKGVNDLAYGKTKHSGGSIDRTGTYRMLKGEHVLTQRAVAQIESGKSGIGGGGRPMHAEVHLHGTNIDEAAAQRLVENALINISRRQ